jgi:hypothetical protein
MGQGRQAKRLRHEAFRPGTGTYGQGAGGLHWVTLSPYALINDPERTLKGFDKPRKN